MEIKSTPKIINFLIVLLHIICVAGSHLNYDIVFNNDGYHRDVQVRAKMKTSKPIRVLMVLKIPPGAFIDPSEMYHLAALNLMESLVEGEVNVEEISDKASSHTLYLFGTITTEKPMDVIFPFHLRYSAPKFCYRQNTEQTYQPYIFVKIELPQFYTKSASCESEMELEAPCDSSNATQCGWCFFPAFTKSEEKAIILEIPTGCYEHLTAVTIVTAVVVLASCIWFTSKLPSFARDLAAKSD